MDETSTLPREVFQNVVRCVQSEDYPDNNDSTRDRRLECCPDSWEALVIGDQKAVFAKSWFSMFANVFAFFRVAIETVIELPIWFSKCVQR